MSSFANSAKSTSSFDIWNAKKIHLKLIRFRNEWWFLVRGIQMGKCLVIPNVLPFLYTKLVWWKFLKTSTSFSMMSSLMKKGPFCHEMSSTWHFLNDSRWPHNTKWFLLDDVMPLNQITAIRWSEFHNFRWKDSSNRHQSFEKNLSFSPEVIFTHLVRLISSNAIMYNLSLVASQTIWRVLVL